MFGTLTILSNVLHAWIVERRVAAIQAICAAETENLLSRLRLLRSYLSKEQLETPAITFFQKNLPNLSVIRNEKYKVFELQWNDKDGYLPGNQVDGRNMSASLDSAGGLQFSVNSGLYIFPYMHFSSLILNIKLFYCLL